MAYKGYTVQNAAFGTIVDLPEANGTNGQFLQGFPVNTNLNDQWRFLPDTLSNNLYAIQNVWSTGYASIGTPAASGNRVVINQTASVWVVSPVTPTAQNVTIGVPYSDLVWTLAASGARTPLTLAVFNGDTAQQWLLNTVD